MIQQLETIKSEKMPMHLCPNWLTGELREQISQVPCKVGRTPQPTTKLLYCGTVGKKQGLLEFCQLLSQSDGEFDFEIRGEGGEAGAVRQWVESSGDRRFRFDTLVVAIGIRERHSCGRLVRRSTKIKCRKFVLS